MGSDLPGAGVGGSSVLTPCVRPHVLGAPAGGNPTRALCPELPPRRDTERSPVGTSAGGGGQGGRELCL